MTTLITGANRGIGLALFDACKDAGDAVIGTTRAAAPGPDWLTLDVTDPASQAGVTRALEGRALDLLVCNAGIYPDKGATMAQGYAPEVWQTGFATNVMGVFLTIQALLPALRRAKAGKIAIIASQMGSQQRVKGGSYVYRASKAAAVNLGRNLALDLAPEGIAVGIYHPGWVRTEMGGGNADIDTQTAAEGLRARFAALSPATSGCFEAWDGAEIPL